MTKMEDYKIELPPGHYSGAREIMLTCTHASCSYGQPVAVLVGGRNDGTAYGHDDVIKFENEYDPLAWLAVTASETVSAENARYRYLIGNKHIHKIVIAFCNGLLEAEYDD